MPKNSGIAARLLKLKPRNAQQRQSGTVQESGGVTTEDLCFLLHHCLASVSALQRNAVPLIDCMASLVVEPPTE
jgi:hypothetical protein